MKLKLTFIALLLAGVQSIAFCQWQFVKGETYAPQLPKYGILNQAHIYNSPGGRQGSATWTYNGSMYLFGGTTAAGKHNDIWKYDPVSKIWTWIKGSSIADDAGVSGIVGTENSTSLPSARSGFCYWVKDDMLYVYSGDMWRYNFQTNNWTFLGGIQTPFSSEPVYGQLGVPGANNKPWGRSGASCWTSANYLYLFGGYINNNMRNDLWRYDLVTGLWTWIKGSSGTSTWYNGVDGTLGVEGNANTPGNKGYGITVQSGNLVYIYGGENGVGVNYTHDLWRFNTVTENWTRLNGNAGFVQPQYGAINVYNSMNTPGSREMGNGWVKDGSFFLFGGRESLNGAVDYYNDIWQFDTVSLQWKYIKGQNISNQFARYNYIGVTVPTSLPGSRFNAIHWDINGSVYLLGGSGYSFSGVGALGDMWSYGKSTNNWTWEGGSNNSSFTSVSYETGVADVNNRPAAGNYASQWSINENVYVFGKYLPASAYIYGDYGSLDELWKYNNNNNDWTLIKPQRSDTTAIAPVYGTLNVSDSVNTPGTRSGQASWTFNNKLYLFGGLSNNFFTWTGDFADSLLSDVWEFDLATKQWKWIKGSNTFHQNGVYGTQGIAAVSNTPGARMNPLFWQANNKFYLFGGRGRAENGNIGCLNDLWEYDPATNNWRWLKGSKLVNQFSTFGTMGTAATNNTPGGRLEGTCWTLNNKLYTFLGRGIEPGNAFGYPQFLHELWVYDIATNNWTWLKGNNSVPEYGVDNYANFGTKGVASATTRPNVCYNPTGSVADGKLYLYGGSAGYEYTGCITCTDVTHNNLWSYDPATNNWTWLEGARNMPVKTVFPDTPVAPLVMWPGTKNNSAYNLSWTYGNTFYIFGGTNYKSNNEVWGYNFCSNPALCNTASPQVWLGNDTAMCSGGYKELNAGNFGSTYLWSTGASTQSIAVTQSGSYWVTVTNAANMSATDTVSITFSTSPSIPFGGNITICAGDPQVLDALNPGCTYMWSTGAISPSITATTGGTYSVTITNAAGCTASASMNIVQAPQPDAYLGPDDGECSYTPGYPQHAIYPASAPGHTYLWNTGDTTEVIFVTQTGDYSLQMTNSYGCTDADTVHITFDTPVAFSLGNDTAICSSIPLILNVYHPECSYYWSDGSNDSVLLVNQPGNYSVSVFTHYGCESADDIIISLLPEPSAASIQATVNNSQVDLFVTNAQNVTDYTWYFGDNTNAQGSTATHIYAQPGTYLVKLVVANVCGTDTLSKDVTITPSPNGVQELLKESGILFFPNPALSYLNIRSASATISSVVISNVLGQVASLSENIDSKACTLNLDGLNPGTYKLTLFTDKGNYATRISIVK